MGFMQYARKIEINIFIRREKIFLFTKKKNGIERTFCREFGNKTYKIIGAIDEREVDSVRKL